MLQRAPNEDDLLAPRHNYRSPERRISSCVQLHDSGDLVEQLTDLRILIWIAHEDRSNGEICDRRWLSPQVCDTQNARELLSPKMFARLPGP